MTALASSPDFIVRPATDDDLNFVRKTWLQEHAQNSDWIDAVGGGSVYFDEHARCRDLVLDDAAITIACRASVPSGICGFAVTDTHEYATERFPVVHFVYVKPRWRKLGVARLLLRPLAEKRALYTHRTNMLRLVPVPKAWDFNPYPFLRIKP